MYPPTSPERRACYNTEIPAFRLPGSQAPRLTSSQTPRLPDSACIRRPPLSVVRVGAPDFLVLVFQAPRLRGSQAPRLPDCQTPRLYVYKMIGGSGGRPLGSLKAG